MVLRRRIFLKESLHDENEVERAVGLADSQTNPIENYVGWIRDCIRKHYKDPQVVSDGSAEKGDRIVEARAIIDETTSDDEKAMSAAYWNKAMKKNSEKYREFMVYLSGLGVTIEMFTDGNEDYECGEKFMQWIKTGQINPF